jgi:hypothetical protein
MRALYRRLLCLYPPAHRHEYGEEMLAVFREVEAENLRKGVAARAAFCAREVGGLLSDALQERFRSIAGFRPGSLFPSRRFTMHSEFRFPKTTAFLMTVILAGVVVAIDKAEAIQVSLPHTNPPVGHIQPAQFVFFPTIALMFAVVYAAGIVGWAILFALRRSGVHRLSEMTSDDQK